MAKVGRAEREAIAERRIINILRTQGVANLRTLEQKIADAGPNPQRIQPHILSPVKTRLLESGAIQSVAKKAPGCETTFFHLSDADPQLVHDRISEIMPVWEDISRRPLTLRTGQALEIAVFRALIASPASVYGGFTESIDSQSDSDLYQKQEVNSVNGKTIGNQALDFIANINGANVGIEVKNIRQWIYPNRTEVIETLRKALTLGVHPVLIGRRIPYVTVRVLGTCGVIMHETFNQRMASHDADVAKLAADKNLLGFHDIRLGNAEDPRLLKFFRTTLPDILEEMQQRFQSYEDLLRQYAFEGMPYKEFAARVRRRENGQKEDNDWEDHEGSEWTPDDEYG